MSKKILIVEDELITALDLKLKLEQLGYEVLDTVSSGDDGIYAAVEKRPDLVLMDINLKGDMDGIEASEKILALDLPVVFLTAHEDVFEKANIRPASGFILKPIDVQKLRETIEFAINRHRIEIEKADLARGITGEPDDKTHDNVDDEDLELFFKAKKEYEDSKISKKPKDSDLKEDKKNILIVEDEQVTALDIKLKLESFGYNVIDSVDSGEEAINKSKTYLPDLVLMDITLKGRIDGIEATKEIENLDIPVIYLTAKTSEQSIKMALKTSPYGYLSKPYVKSELKHAVAVAIKKHEDVLDKIEVLEDKIKEKNQELVIEKIHVTIIIVVSLSLIILGLLSRDLTWLQWILFIPAAIMVFLAIASLFKQDKVIPYEVPPFVTMLVPAHNEEHTIEECVRSLANVDYFYKGKRNFELIVINDGSEDRTGEVLTGLKEEFSYLKVITRVPPRSGKGKGFVLNDGLEIAKGEAIAVFDADARVDPDFLSIIIPYLNEENVQGVQSRIKMYNKDENFLTAMQHVELAGFGNIVRAKDILGKAGFLGGNGQIVKREAIYDSGGWDGFAITEDLNLSVKLMINGFAIRYCGETCVYQEAVPTLRQLFRQRARWAIGNFETLFIYTTRILRAPIPFFRMFGVIEHVAFYGLNMLVFFGFCVFATNIFWYLSFNAFIFRMDASLAVALISAFGFFPGAVITLARDKVSLPSILVKTIGYWIYCFHLIPLFFITCYQMLTRKERTWAKTAHRGDDELTEEERSEENLLVGNNREIKD